MRPVQRRPRAFEKGVKPMGATIMTRTMRRRRPGVLRHAGMGIALLLSLAAGCPKKDQAPSATRPSGLASSALTTRPTSTPASQPAASQPVVKPPESSYDAKPPYPVMLYVRDPAEKQPGWLRILELNVDGQLATTAGTFPRKNRIHVETNNVRRLRLHLGQLPLAEGKRTVLQIDKQGIELKRRGREYVYLERRPTGAWNRVDPPEE